MKLTTNKIAFIMAGGIGERFWPITSETFPKYAMSMNEKQSFLQATFDRLKTAFPEKNIGVITSAKHRKLILKLLPKINPSLLLCEPQRKNTAAAVTWGTIVAKQIIGENGVVSFYPADALILNPEKFATSIRLALNNAREQITLLGVPPSRPSTAYGYIQIEKNRQSIAKVLHFKEKPKAVVAKRYLASGDFLWNAGIFFWTPKVYLSEMVKHNKTYLNYFKTLNGTESASSKKIASIFKRLPSEPIDKLLIEKVQNLICVKANFEWDDIGSWEALHRMNTQKKSDNLILSQCIATKASGNIVYGNELKFAIHGVDDLIIAEKDGVVMICPRSDAEGVKDIRKNWFRKQK